MAEIISFDKIRNEQEDKENGFFAIRQEDGALKDVTLWDGGDWQTLVDGVFGAMETQTGVSRWDILADFMRSVLNVPGGEP